MYSGKGTGGSTGGDEKVGDMGGWMWSMFVTGHSRCICTCAGTQPAARPTYAEGANISVDHTAGRAEAADEVENESIRECRRCFRDRHAFQDLCVRK